jgi:hypothetical protein
MRNDKKWKGKSKTEISQPYGIPLSTLSTYLNNWECIQKQALEGAHTARIM